MKDRSRTAVDEAAVAALVQASGRFPLRRWFRGPYTGGRVDEACQMVEEEWAKITGPRWPLRVLGGGLVMGFAVGIPIGTLLAFFTPLAELPGGSRDLVVFVFLCVTLVWTIPFSFVARYVSMRSLRDFIVGIDDDGRPDGREP